jgi:mono/diheme cytochrome c family protein
MRKLYDDAYPDGVPRALIALSLVLGALVIGGCSGERSAAPAGGAPAGTAPGAQVFADAGCGGCHTLAAAGSTGTVGPSLDALKPDAERVVLQVTNGGRGMPAFDGQLTRREIADVAAFVAAAAAKSPVSVAARFTPDETKIADCGAGDSPCFEQAFGNLAYEKGPKRALAVFTRMIDTDPTVHVCHRIAHAIGAGALAHYHGKVGPAFADGSAVCWSGYYHGILERAFEGVSEQDLPAVARRLCASHVVRRNTFTAYQCVHGLGHGLMIYTGYDLPLALQTCDALATAWDQTSCTGGVFMENLQTSYGTTSEWLRDDDPLYPCPTVAERDKLYCYLMVTSRILDVVGGDWQKTVDWCRKAETNWVATCFQSLGRDASGRSLQDPSKILGICALAGGMARECIYGAARDITSMDAGARRSTGFCAKAPARNRTYCFNGVGTILGGFSNHAGSRRAACRAAVPKRYWPDCFAGAGASPAP